MYVVVVKISVIFFFQAEDGIRDGHVTGVQTCALPISIQCSVAVQRTNTVLLPMAVLKAKQPGVLKIEMTHVNDIRSVPRLLDIKSFNHDRKTGVLNSLINREAGICGLVVGDAAKEDFIIPAFPFYTLLRRQPVPAPSKSFRGSGNAA